MLGHRTLGVLAVVAVGAAACSGNGTGTTIGFKNDTGGSGGSGAGATVGSGAGATTGSGAGATTGSGAGATTSTGAGAGATTGSGAGGSTASNCPVFLPTSPWNTDISTAPTTTAFKLPSANLHPDFDNDPVDGIPYQYVNNSVAKSPVTFQYATESDPGPYPIPANPLIEGAGAGGDRHILMIHTDECVLYELFAASKSGSTWHAGSGAIWDLKTNSTRPQCWTSADAAGLPIFPGLVRLEEVKAGAINHALRFTMNTIQTGFVPPANHLTDSSSNPSDPPYGLRVRLKASVDISQAPPQAKIILTAMKKYGLILADAGSDWYISGASDPGWDFDNDVTYIEQFAGSDFEVVKPGPITGPVTCPP